MKKGKSQFYTILLRNGKAIYMYMILKNCSYYQRQCFLFGRSVCEVIRTLESLFNMDVYLPRSIVACLKVNELVKVLNEPMVPVEVACAAALHWIKTTKSYGYIYASDKVCFYINKHIQ